MVQSFKFVIGIAPNLNEALNDLVNKLEADQELAGFTIQSVFVLPEMFQTPMMAQPQMRCNVVALVVLDPVLDAVYELHYDVKQLLAVFESKSKNND